LLAGAILAGILVPAFVIAIIGTIWYYRRYRLHKREEDRIALSDPTYGASNLAVINLTEVNNTDHEEDNDLH
jgi:hypothetical protein